MIAHDKRLHLAAGVLICLFVGIALTPMWGFLFAVIVGALKELVWDWHWGRGTPEWPDFWATCAGGLAGVYWLAIFW